MTDRSPDLGDLLRELRAIRNLLEPRVRRVSKADRVILERLLPAIAAVFSDGELFTSRELVAHLAPGLRVLRGGMSTKQVGRLLARTEGITIAGFRVECHGTEANVKLWRVTLGEPD